MIQSKQEMLYLFVFTHVFIPSKQDQKSVQWTDFPAKTVPTFGRHALAPIHQRQNKLLDIAT